MKFKTIKEYRAAYKKYGRMGGLETLRKYDLTHFSKMGKISAYKREQKKLNGPAALGRKRPDRKIITDPKRAGKNGII